MKKCIYLIEMPALSLEEEQRMDYQNHIRFLQSFVKVFDERIKNPSNGIITKKAATLANAKTKLGYNPAQLAVIQKVDELRPLIFGDGYLTSEGYASHFPIDKYPQIKALTLDILNSGKVAFPDSGKFKRVARVWTLKNSKGNPLISSYQGSKPDWWTSSGGRRHSTRRRTMHKRGTHKRKTHKRRTHKRHH
jgi:hypothetical protein